ncbi:MAG: alpha-2-macroglobulin [Hyphomicrobiales bacterium]
MRIFRILFALIFVLAAPATASAIEKAFYREDIAVDAVRYEKALKASEFASERPAKAWRQAGDRARARGDMRTASVNYETVVKLAPADWATFIELSRAYLGIETDNWQERWDLPQKATSAAYIAYLRAPDAAAEGKALAALGAALARREIWRPAIDAYKASLDASADDAVAATYRELRDMHGFRVLDYSVDSDAITPRACVQFSENLSTATRDFAPFVSVEGNEAPIVTAEAAAICIDGLKHGERYNVLVRDGVPSSVGEVLENTVDLSFYVRDRSASVRFTGRNYVLPRTGQRGLPLITVNAPVVKAEIYRIGDRSLVNAVLGGDFQRQIDGGAMEKLITDKAEKVWSGEMPVEGALNADVTTAFPVDEAVGDMAPGVYVMFADPAGKEVDYWDSRPTQWFVVSDLGLASISGTDGVHGFVRSLATAEPVADATVRLISKSNEVLAERRSDETGHVRFEAGLARGEGPMAPAVLVAEAGNGDYAFIDMSAAAFDLTDRGVEGRAAPGALDAYLVTERGVYRSGETVHSTTLLRDGSGKAVAGLPLTLVVARPDGVEFNRSVVADDGLGGRALDIQLLDDAMHGTWRIEAFADPKGKPVGAATFLVEDYVPDRLEIALASEAKAIGADAPANVAVDGRYLYGAPAAGLGLAGEVVVHATDDDARAGYPGYAFGLTDEEVTPVRRAVEKTLKLPVAATGPAIGIRPGFAGDSIGEGETAEFDVIAIAENGERLSLAGLKWDLVRIETRYQWYSRWGGWDFEKVSYTTRVADGTIEVGTADAGHIAAKVDWGSYRLDVSSPDPAGPVASYGFDVGWQPAASADSPDVLEVALDKESYAAGETARLNIAPRFAGKAVVAVIGEGVETLKTVDVPAEGTTVEIPVDAAWTPGAYVTAMLYRPLDVEAKRMPGRAVGLAWLKVDTAGRTLGVGLEAPAVARPMETLVLPVKLDGLAAGEKANVVVAAVDVGILNLTGYKAPAPEEWYYAQRALSAELRDLYGGLIDGMQAPRGSIRSGGDSLPEAQLQGSPPAQAPLALYSGIVTVDDTGTASVEFELPAFAGTVRVMAEAWSLDKIGHSAADVIVRDPVVVLASAPRFLAAGDLSRVRLDIDNADGVAGDYSLTLATDGPLALGDIAAEQSLALKAGEKTAINVPLAATGVGMATLSATLEGPDGLRIERSYALGLRPATAVTSRRMVQSIAPGGSLTVSADLLADLVSGTGSVSLAVGPGATLDLPALLAALDRYPYGCAEQITSRAMPLLYVADLAATAGLTETDPRETVDGAIARVLAKEGSNGSFGRWGPGGADLWLDAYVTDFLTRARERGFKVPDGAFTIALDHLRNAVSYSGEIEDGGGQDIAYALYVLARNGRAPVGDLRYFADTKIEDFGSPLARAQIGAALAMIGDKTRAEAAFGSALAFYNEGAEEGYRADYGSLLRDGAATLALAAETGSAPEAVPALASALDALGTDRPGTSTQEQAWLVLAANALMTEGAKARLTVAGAAHEGTYVGRFDAAALDGGDLTVGNDGETEVPAVITVTGAPTTPEDAASEGFSIERQAFTLEGEEVDPATVAQNTRLLIALRIEQPDPEPGRILVVDRLPAGFEIDNPRLVTSADLASLPWLTGDTQPDHVEFRDDRFVASIDQTSGGSPSFTIAYMVRAVTPGTYVRPAATVEDMYRPHRFARTGPETVEVEAAK